LTIETAQIAKQLIKDVETNKLIVPSLPEVITRIKAAINDQKRGTQQIARLIQLDPGLTARLIQIANSAGHRGNFPIDTCQMAITRLGLRTTRNLVTALVMHNVFKSDSPKLHKRIRELWKHSCRVAAIAFVLARVNKNGLDPDKALLAGLVHDIGVLPILHYAAGYPEILADEARLNTLIYDLKGKLGRYILEKWDFGADLLSVPERAEDWLYSQGENIDYVDIVIIARIHSQLGTENKAGVPVLTEIPAFRKMSIATLGPGASIELLHEAQGEIQTLVKMLLT